MTRQQSEGELHVEAMRLMIEAQETRENPPDWTVWRHMLGLLATIFRGIEDQRQDDQDELMHTRKDRDDWREEWQGASAAGELMKAEIDSLRQQLAEAQQQGVDAMRAEVERLRTFVGTVRSASSYFRGSTEWHKIEAALAELDAQPAPVAKTAEGSDEG